MVAISAAGLADEAAAQGGIKGGGALISGKYSESEARNIAIGLMNPLENLVSIEEFIAPAKPPEEEGCSQNHREPAPDKIFP